MTTEKSYFQPKDDLPQRLRALVRGFHEWRVENPQDGSYCMSMTRDDSVNPEKDCRDWLEIEKRAGGQFAEYIVKHHHVLTEKDKALAEAADALGALQVDAARYRLVRRGQHWSVINGIGDTLSGDALDAAADAKLAARRPESMRCAGCDLINGCPEYCRCTPAIQAPEGAPSFDAWWAQIVTDNGGAEIGADYRHWALLGYRAALAAQPSTDNNSMGQTRCYPAGEKTTQAPAEGAAPVGWRIEFGAGEIALHQRGTAQPTYYPEGTVEYALLRDIAAGAQVEAPDLLRMVLDDIAVCIDVHGEHSTEVWESKELSTETVETLEALRRKLKAGDSKAQPKGKATGKVAATYGDKWEGAEEWMPLAWELCANECGEEACTELIWEGGPIPEPWGDRWMKYEDQAKEMIAMVRASLAAVQAPAVEEPMEMALCESVSLVLREGQAYRFHRVGDCERCMRMSAASRDAYGTVGIDMPAHVGALAVAPASEDPPAGPLDYMVPRVAKALKEAIKGRGLTQAELARRLECTEAEVSDRLSGRRNLTLSTMSEMCDLTGLRMDVRFYEPSKPPVQGSQP